MARRRPSVIPPRDADRRPLNRPVWRREWIAIAALVLLAAGLRFAFPGRMAVEHFDEGVYSSNIFFTAEEGGQYPYRHLYAPPLLPFLIEWGIIFLGPESIAPFLPALIFGTATVPLAWWAARCWFGTASGLVAALLVATSDFHILYSRTALTDVPVAFFLLLAVYLYWEAVRRESVQWAVIAGIATGLAWWTKYTGWLPLAIAASGSAGWVLFERRAAGVSPRVRLLTVSKLFAVMAVTACVVWSPVLWGLQQYGGYAAVAENHRGYLQPLSAWPQTLVTQAAHLAEQSGGPTTLGLMVFTAAIPFASRWPVYIRVPLSLWSAGTTGWVVFALGPAFALAVLAFAALAASIASATLRSPMEVEVPDSRSARTLAAWLLLAGFIGLVVTIPLYYPYSRLAMPWTLVAMLGTAVWASSSLGPLIGQFSGRGMLPAAILILPLGMFVERFPKGGDRTAGASVPGWEDRTGLRIACRDALAAIDADRPGNEACLVNVFGEGSSPAVFYHLAAATSGTKTLVRPSGSLQSASRLTTVPTYLVWSSRHFVWDDVSEHINLYRTMDQLDAKGSGIRASTSLFCLLDVGVKPKDKQLFPLSLWLYRARE